MYVNIIKSYRNVVAICDAELLSKKFEENNMQLDVKENFYKGSENNYPTTKKEVIEIINNMKIEDATFNIIGEKSIKIAIETGIINKDSVGTIQGVPFALVLL